MRYRAPRRTKSGTQIAQKQQIFADFVAIKLMVELFTAKRQRKETSPYFFATLRSNENRNADCADFTRVNPSHPCQSVSLFSSQQRIFSIKRRQRYQKFDFSEKVELLRP